MIGGLSPITSGGGKPVGKEGDTTFPAGREFFPCANENAVLCRDGVSFPRKNAGSYLLMVVASMKRWSSNCFFAFSASMTLTSMMSLPRTPTTLPL